MTLIRHDISRRAVLAASASALAAAAPVSQAATRAHQPFGLRVARIGLAAPSPGLHTTSLALRNVAVDVLTPGFDDSAANEAFHVASLAGHVVMLDGGDPNRIGARAEASGVRLFRDHTICGKRLIQLDPAVFGVRFETAHPRMTTASAPGDALVTGLVAACEDPERAAALAGAILGVRAGRKAIDLGACRITFTRPEAANGVRGLREVHLDASQAGYGPDVTLAGVTWRCAQSLETRSLLRADHDGLPSAGNF